MIQSFYPEDFKGGCDGCRTTGCSCCANNLNIGTDEEKILLEAEDNIRVVKKICRYYKISFERFCAKVAMEKKGVQ